MAVALESVGGRATCQRNARDRREAAERDRRRSNNADEQRAPRAAAAEPQTARWPRANRLIGVGQKFFHSHDEKIDANIRRLRRERARLVSEQRARHIFNAHDGARVDDALGVGRKPRLRTKTIATRPTAATKRICAECETSKAARNRRPPLDGVGQLDKRVAVERQFAERRKHANERFGVERREPIAAEDEARDVPRFDRLVAVQRRELVVRERERLQSRRLAGAGWRRLLTFSAVSVLSADVSIVCKPLALMCSSTSLARPANACRRSTGSATPRSQMCVACIGSSATSIALVFVAIAVDELSPAHCTILTRYEAS